MQIKSPKVAPYLYQIEGPVVMIQETGFSCPPSMSMQDLVRLPQVVQ